MNETTTKAHKRPHVLVDVKVEADMSGMACVYHGMPLEQRARGLERAIKDFHHFLRDHRSQDMVVLDIQRIHKDLCSACGADWEPDEVDGVAICANCGAEIEEAPQ